MRMLVKVGLISLTVCLAACSGSFRAISTHSEDAFTIEQIYNQHHAESGQEFERRSFVPQGTTHLSGYSRQAHNELALHFPRLPNPTIVMYVFPHLSSEGTPVPGYSTTFSMYETVEYALPGEILPR